MRTIVKLMKEYAQRHSIKKGIMITFEDDESGAAYVSGTSSVYSVHCLFKWDTIKELFQKLKQ